MTCRPSLLFSSGRRCVRRGRAEATAGERDFLDGLRHGALKDCRVFSLAWGLLGTDQPVRPQAGDLRQVSRSGLVPALSSGLEAADGVSPPAQLW